MRGSAFPVTSGEDSFSFLESCPWTCCHPTGISYITTKHITAALPQALRAVGLPVNISQRISVPEPFEQQGEPWPSLGQASIQWTSASNVGQWLLHHCSSCCPATGYIGRVVYSIKIPLFPPSLLCWLIQLTLQPQQDGLP